MSIARKIAWLVWLPAVAWAVTYAVAEDRTPNIPPPHTRSNLDTQYSAGSRPRTRSIIEPYHGETAVIYFDYNDRSNSFGADPREIRQLCEGDCPVFKVHRENYFPIFPSADSKTELIGNVQQAVRRLQTAPSPRLIILIESHGSNKSFCHDDFGKIAYTELWKEIFHSIEGSWLQDQGVVDILVNACYSRKAASSLEEVVRSDEGRFFSPGSPQRYSFRINVFSAAKGTAYESDFWDLVKGIGETNAKASQAQGKFQNSMHLSVKDGAVFSGFERSNILRPLGEKENDHGIWSSYQTVPSISDSWDPLVWHEWLFLHSLYGKDEFLFSRMADRFEYTTRGGNPTSDVMKARYKLRESMILRLEFAIVSREDEGMVKKVGKFMWSMRNTPEQRMEFLKKSLWAPSEEIRYRLLSSIPYWNEEMKQLARARLDSQPAKVRNLLTPLLRPAEGTTAKSVP